MGGRDKLVPRFLLHRQLFHILKSFHSWSDRGHLRGCRCPREQLAWLLVGGLLVSFCIAELLGRLSLFVLLRNVVFGGICPRNAHFCHTRHSE